MRGDDLPSVTNSINITAGTTIIGEIGFGQIRVRTNASEPHTPDPLPI